MLAVAIIVFREVLEAALIIGIVLAASVGLTKRGRWVSAGIGAGLAGAGLTAGFAAAITDSLSGSGQEVFNAAILGIAVVMLAWHTIWMAKHGREMAARARGVTAEISDGTRHVRALAIIVAAAVLREGAETVLFITGIAASGDEAAIALASGVLLGLAGGVMAGGALYAGLLRIPVGRLFSVTGWLVLLLAAGLAAQAAGFLIQADLLPSLGDQLWDSTFLLDENGIAGRAMHTLIGYVARPAGTQVLTYAATLLAVGVPMVLLRQPRGGRLAVAAAATAFASCTTMSPAWADLKVRSPIVEFGEVEFEHNGLVTIGKRGSDNDRAQSYTVSAGYGVTPWWKLELEGEYVASAGRGTSRGLTWEATTIENIFQLTPQGKYFVDVGFFAEYSRARGRRDPDEVVFGPIFQKELNDVLGVDTLHTLNVFVSRTLGRGATRAMGLEYAWQSRLFLNGYADPAIEAYGEIENLAHSGHFRQQSHVAGPALVGGLDLHPGKLKYEVGYMFGLTPAAPYGGARWKLELEFRF